MRLSEFLHDLPVTPLDRDGFPYRADHLFSTPLAQAQAPELLTTTVTIDGVALTPVRFSYAGEPGSQVLLHLNSFTDRQRHRPHGALMREVSPGLFALSWLLPSTLTASYRYVPLTELPETAGANRENWLKIHRAGVVDPKNPEKLQNPLGSASSVLSLPDSPRHPAWQGLAGRSAEAVEQSERSATVTTDWKTHCVILHSTSDSPSHLLVLFDASFLEGAQVHTALSSYQRNLATVLVDSGTLEERGKFLTNPAEVAAVLRKIHRNTREWFGRSFEPSETILAGQSFGGLAAATAVLRNPELAKLAIPQSGSYWFSGKPRPSRTEQLQRGVNPEIITLAQNADPGIRMVLQAGTEEAELSPMSRALHSALRERHLQVALSLYSGGHDYAWWRHGLFDGLDLLLAP